MTDAGNIPDGIEDFGRGQLKDFQKWRREHLSWEKPPGYVLNALPDSPWEMLIHRADCKYLEPSGGKGSVATDDFHKYCCEDLDGLRKWAKAKYRQEPRCHDCL